MEERSCMTAAKNTLKFHFQVTRGCQSILRAPSTKTRLKSCCVEPSSEIYSGDMKSSAIINQTPCRGGQCLNIATRENSREASTSFTLRPADHHSWMEPHTTGGPQDDVWLYWSHTHCLLGMYSQCDFFDKGKDIYRLWTYVCSYPSIGVKPSPSQEVWLLAKDFFPLLFHPCQLQEWIHFTTYLHFYTCKWSFSMSRSRSHSLPSVES